MGVRVKEFRTLALSLPGRAQQRGSKVFVVGKNGKPAARDSNRKSKSWMEYVRTLALSEMNRQKVGGLFDGPVRLTARFFFERPRSHYLKRADGDVLREDAPALHAHSPDLAKLLRSLEDALTGVVYVDDRLVCFYGEGTGRYWGVPRTEVLIEEVEYVEDGNGHEAV